jgi:hypothetical protein
VANHREPASKDPSLRRDRHRRSRPSRTILNQIDLLDAVRVISGLGAGAWTGSVWWFVGAVAYNVAGGPLHKVVDAFADLVVDWIRHRWRDPPPP